MQLDKSDIAYISEMLQELNKLKQGEAMGADALKYAETLETMSEAMCHDDIIEIADNVPCPFVSYTHG